MCPDAPVALPGEFCPVRHHTHISVDTQTYLATYFCFVDFTLLSQYFYYASRSEKTTRSGYRHNRERTTTGTISTRRLSLDRTASAPHYRALSNVAANVAAVAALAAQQEEQARWHGRPHSTEPRPTAYDDDEDISEDALTRLAESFHSERAPSARRKQVALSHDLYPSREASTRRSRQSSRVPNVLQMTASIDGVESLTRGRPPVRAADLAEEEHEWLSANSTRRGSRASRKGATMVFLGVWALFGVGTLVGGGRHSLSTAVVGKTGRILEPTDIPAPFVAESTLDTLVHPILSAQLAGEPMVLKFTHSTRDTSGQPPEPGPTMEHTIGRISAWICTTLYLTSRLPQIWKNVCSFILASPW